MQPDCMFYPLILRSKYKNASMLKTTFKIPKMDCPTEERLIRMKLESFPEIKKLKFDLAKRSLDIFHTHENEKIVHALKSLNFGAKKVQTLQVSDLVNKEDNKQQRKILLWVLAINFTFFILEMTTGIISKSMGLVADSLDMLADSTVYLLSLWAVGATMIRKKKVAQLSGYFQLLLAGLGILEVIRRFFGKEQIPNYEVMMIVAFLALIANAISLIILHKAKSEEAHIKASLIFTSNDIAINLGVILAGIFVMLTHSKYPDLIIGGIIFLIVVQGALRILKLSK